MSLNVNVNVDQADLLNQNKIQAAANRQAWEEGQNLSNTEVKAEKAKTKSLETLGLKANLQRLKPSSTRIEPVPDDRIGLNYGGIPYLVIMNWNAVINDDLKVEFKIKGGPAYKTLSTTLLSSDGSYSGYIFLPPGWGREQFLDSQAYEDLNIWWGADIDLDLEYKTFAFSDDSVTTPNSDGKHSILFSSITDREEGALGVIATGTLSGSTIYEKEFTVNTNQSVEVEEILWDEYADTTFQLLAPLYSSIVGPDIENPGIEGSLDPYAAHGVYFVADDWCQTGQAQTIEDTRVFLAAEESVKSYYFLTIQDPDTGEYFIPFGTVRRYEVGTLTSGVSYSSGEICATLSASVLRSNTDLRSAVSISQVFGNRNAESLYFFSGGQYTIEFTVRTSGSDSFFTAISGQFQLVLFDLYSILAGSYSYFTYRNASNQLQYVELPDLNSSILTGKTKIAFVESGSTIRLIINEETIVAVNWSEEPATRVQIVRLPYFTLRPSVDRGDSYQITLCVSEVKAIDEDLYPVPEPEGPEE
jgi:hypothetical protein